jgi:hypothetical protein
MVGYLNQLRTQVEDMHRKKLQERLANRVGGVAIIKVGAGIESS